MQQQYHYTSMTARTRPEKLELQAKGAGGVRRRRRRKAVGSQGNRWWRVLVPVLFMESRTVKSVRQDILCIFRVRACVCVCVWGYACRENWGGSGLRQIACKWLYTPLPKSLFQLIHTPSHSPCLFFFLTEPGLTLFNALRWVFCEYQTSICSQS